MAEVTKEEHVYQTAMLRDKKTLRLYEYRRLIRFTGIMNAIRVHELRLKVSPLKMWKQVSDNDLKNYITVYNID